MNKSEHTRKAVSERFMRQHYGASGFVSKHESPSEVGEDARIAVAKFCDERNLNYTLGTMLEMARFAEEYTAKIGRLKLRSSR